MNTSIQDLPAGKVGERLRGAREKAQVTQAQAANAIGAARTTLVAIESGQRRVRHEELLVLCHLYGTSMNALFREEAIHIEFEPQFRKLLECKSEVTLLAASMLSQLVRAEIELENLLGIKRVSNDPPERRIMAGDVRKQAEQNALELRQWLGLGTAPVLDTVTLLEMTLGARVYLRPINGKLSAVFVYHPLAGPCILLNASHPASRRNQSAAHELARLLTTRNKPVVSEIGMANSSREERYADAFARSFLTPTRQVREKFAGVTAGSDKLTRRHVIILAHFFGVSREAMVRRLEELDLAKRGTWDWFEKEGGISDAQERQVLGSRAHPDGTASHSSEPIALRLNLLAAEVYRQGLMSEGQLSRLLGISRVELRELLDESEREGIEAHDGTIVLE